jgi:hypothetical protein
VLHTKRKSEKEEEKANRFANRLQCTDKIKVTSSILSAASYLHLILVSNAENKLPDFLEGMLLM